jgi:hypothetical protein
MTRPLAYAPHRVRTAASVSFVKGLARYTFRDVQKRAADPSRVGLDCATTRAAVTAAVDAQETAEKRLGYAPILQYPAAVTQ